MSGDLYHAVYTNAGGSVATAPATLTLYTPPVVIGNPVNRAVNVGATVSFTASASGTPTPIMQWQTSTDGVHWSNITGATSATYSITTTGNMTGSMYRVQFSNSIGTAVSNAATLTVYTPPTIATNPVSQSVAVGTTVTLTAAAGGTPVPTVQWQVSTNNGTSWTNISVGAGSVGGGVYIQGGKETVTSPATIPDGSTLVVGDAAAFGATVPAATAPPQLTSSTYTFTVTAAMSGYEYQAFFMSPQGLIATTTAATLTVTTPPAVKTNPANQSATAGATVTFTAAATGSPAPTVQWQSSPDGTTWSNIAGATSASYSFTATTSASGTQYRAVFTNSLGTATTTAAKLSVNAPPAVTINPASQSVLAGATVSFTAAATGATSQQWQVSTNNGTSWTNIAGATGASYSVKTTTAMSGYEYRMTFTNSFGSTSSAAATLTVAVAPAVTTSPASVTAVAGQAVAFTAAASGSPTPTVQWQSSANGTTWTNISGATSTTYTVTATSALTGYQYRAVFSNAAGTATTAAAKLTVNWSPTVTSGPAAQSVLAGTAVSFTAAATGSPAPTVQWQVSTNSGSTWTSITGATATTYTFTAAVTQSGFLYRALFTNSLGSTATVSAELTVTSAAKMKVVSAAGITAAETNLDNANSLSNKNSLSAAAVDAVMAHRL